MILTRGEAESKRQRILDRMRILEHHGMADGQKYADLVDELDDMDFLLGDK